MIEKRKGLFCPVCDICGTELKWYDTFDEAVQAEKDAEDRIITGKRWYTELINIDELIKEKEE